MTNNPHFDLFRLPDEHTELRMVVPGNPRIVLQHLAFGHGDD